MYKMYRLISSICTKRIIQSHTSQQVLGCCGCSGTHNYPHKNIEVKSFHQYYLSKFSKDKVACRTLRNPPATPLIHLRNIYSSTLTLKNINPKDVKTFSEENLEEWTHPDNRHGDEKLKDPELKAFLRELAADFGEGVSNQDEVSHDEDVVVRFEGATVVKKEEEDKPFLQKSELLHKRKDKEVPPVFNIESITKLLQEENAQDICVIRIPPERQYVDYFIIVTGRSTRHLNAMTQSINKIYKQRKTKRHPFVIIEGKETDDWMCLDFGNMVIHFMSEEMRELYELEKLWLLGPEYDDHFQRLLRHQESLRQALSQSLEETGEEEMDGQR